jgi:chemotaxis protein CheC
VRTAYPLRANQLDAVREISNIGAGHAATALSKMVDAKVMISVPQISLTHVNGMAPLVPGPEEPVVGIELRLVGDFTGWTLLVFPLADARRLAQLLLKRPLDMSQPIGEMEQSAIQEVGNILSSAYVSALSTLLGMLVIPLPPTLSVDPSASVISSAYLRFGSADDFVLRIESEFIVEGSTDRLRGFFLLMPDADSVPIILKAVKM